MGVVTGAQKKWLASPFYSLYKKFFSDVRKGSELTQNNTFLLKIVFIPSCCLLLGTYLSITMTRFIRMFNLKFDAKWFCNMAISW